MFKQSKFWYFKFQTTRIQIEHTVLLLSQFWSVPSQLQLMRPFSWSALMPYSLFLKKSRETKTWKVRLEIKKRSIVMEKIRRKKTWNVLLTDQSYHAWIILDISRDLWNYISRPLLEQMICQSKPSWYLTKKCVSSIII